MPTVVVRGSGLELVMWDLSRMQVGSLVNVVDESRGFMALFSDSSHRYMFSSICLGAQTSSMIPERPGSALYQRALHRVGGIGGTSAGRTFVCVAHEMEDI